MLKGKIQKNVSRSTWAEYGDGIRVEIRYLSQDALRELRAKAVKRSWDPKTHRQVEEVDNEKFYELYAEATIVNWEGLTGDKLRGMIPMAEYPEGNVPFTAEDAAALMLNCQSFDQFVTYMATELEAHEAARKAAEVKNSQPSHDGS